MSWTTATFALVLASVALLFLDRCSPPPPPGLIGDDGAASIFGSPTSSAPLTPPAGHDCDPSASAHGHRAHPGR